MKRLVGHNCADSRISSMLQSWRVFILYVIIINKYKIQLPIENATRRLQTKIVKTRCHRCYGAIFMAYPVILLFIRPKHTVNLYIYGKDVKERLRLKLIVEEYRGYIRGYIVSCSKMNIIILLKGMLHERNIYFRLRSK